MAHGRNLDDGGQDLGQQWGEIGATSAYSQREDASIVTPLGKKSPKYGAIRHKVAKIPGSTLDKDARSVYHKRVASECPRSLTFVVMTKSYLHRLYGGY